MFDLIMKLLKPRSLILSYKETDFINHLNKNGKYILENVKGKRIK